jgi:hypothetical protein
MAVVLRAGARSCSTRAIVCVTAIQAAWLLGVDVARAQDKAQCAASYADGQRAERRGALRDARRLLLVCARDPCPAVLQPDCTSWLQRIDERLPTVVIEAHDAHGGDVADARVFVDGAPVAERLDGRPIELDPGERTVRVEAATGRSSEQRIVVRDAEKSRKLVFQLEPPPTAAAPKAESSGFGRVPLPAWVLGGVGVVALGSFSYFGITGLNDRADLETCK